MMPLRHLATEGIFSNYSEICRAKRICPFCLQKMQSQTCLKYIVKKTGSLRSTYLLRRTDER